MRDARKGRVLSGAALYLALALATACSDENPGDGGERIPVKGLVHDAQANTRLFFYDEDLNQLGPLSIQVRQDGSYGLSFEDTFQFAELAALAFDLQRENAAMAARPAGTA